MLKEKPDSGFSLLAYSSGMALIIGPSTNLGPAGSNPVTLSTYSPVSS